MKIIRCKPKSNLSNFVQIFFVFLFIPYFNWMPASTIAQEEANELSEDNFMDEIAEGDASTDTELETDESTEDSSSTDFLDTTTDEDTLLLQLPEFLFAIHLGPFFSLGEWVGLLSEIEFQFKLTGSGYLNVIGSFHIGDQMTAERDDYLASGTIGYRHYFVTSSTNAWTLMGGCGFGYYTTSADRFVDEGYDWMHLGLRVTGGHNWFFSDRFSLSLQAGMLIAHQFSEFFDEEAFTVVVPEVLLGISF